MNVLCPDAERDLILAGARHLVVPGDYGECNCMVPWLDGDGQHAPDCSCFKRASPKRWEDAPGPCPTCGGAGHLSPATRSPQNDYGHQCRGCIGGRKRVALAVPDWCEVDTCQAERHRHPSNANMVCNLGFVVFAHATVEVLPVEWAGEHKPRPARYVWMPGDGTVMLATLGAMPMFVPLALDPLPVPGRDFVVLLDNVEPT